MKKRILSFALFLALCLSLLPAGVVSAASGYGIWVNGEEFTSTKTEIKCGEGTATLANNGDRFTLTLKYATITKHKNYTMIYAESVEKPIDIILIGKNLISTPQDDEPDMEWWRWRGIWCKELTIRTNGTDPGTLEIELGESRRNHPTFCFDAQTVTIKDASVRYTYMGMGGDGGYVYHTFVSCFFASSRIKPAEMTIDNAEISVFGSAFSEDEEVTVTFKAKASDYEISAGKKMYGSDAFAVPNIDTFLGQSNGGYQFYNIQPKAEHTGIWVSGEEFTSKKATILCDYGKAILEDNGDRYTLTLDHATITKNKNNKAIYVKNAGKPIDIILKGKTLIMLKDGFLSTSSSSAIDCGDAITLKTDGEVPGSLDIRLWNRSGYQTVCFHIDTMTIKDVEVYFMYRGDGTCEFISQQYYQEPANLTIDNAQVIFSGAYFTDRESDVITFLPNESNYAILAGKKADGSDAKKVSNPKTDFFNTEYLYFDIRYTAKPIEKLDFTFDIPNDGEEYPAEKVGIERVTKVPEGVKVVGVETVQFSKAITGKAVANDLVTFGIIYEILPGYELASGAVATINGKEALKVLTGTGVRKVAFKDGVRITTNPTIKITKDLPQTIEYTKGETISLSITATGKNMTYQWQIGVPSTGRKPAVYTDFGENKNAATYTPSESDDGKIIRCKITNADGNAYTTVAYLKLVEKHSALKGDINGDGKVNAMDCLLLKGYILKTFKNATAEQIERMNVSGDKTINAVDYALLRAAVLGTKVL